MARPCLRSAAAAALGVACAGCGGVLEPVAAQAGRIAGVWWLNFWFTFVIYAALMVAVGLSVRRCRSRSQEPERVEPPPSLEQRRTLETVALATAVSALLLGVLAFADFRTRAVGRAATQPLVVEVTGHQWWWDFQYPDGVPANTVTSPNELHLPVGRDVRLDLASHDVIHSLWMPNFNGKVDLIPGRPSMTLVHALRPGRFDGQCAEFCGIQHATMRFTVVSEPPAAFQAWLAAQRRTPPAALDPEQARGRQVFLRSTCVMCHAIQGTSAGSHMGPDLTHVGSRAALAAATLPNVREHMIGWISNPQATRPGVQMPPQPLSQADIASLATYLGSLK